MKKSLLIPILALFLLAISANALPGFNVIENFKNLTGIPLQTLSSSFTVNNNGTENLAINFTGYDLTLSGSSDKLSITGLSNISLIPNGTSQTAAFSVVIPNQQKPGLYTGILTAASNATITDAITINVNVTPYFNAAATPSQIDLGTAGLNTTHTRTFNITNTGNANITNVSFGFSATGFDLKSNKTNFILPFNATDTISFNLTIPADFSTGVLTLGAVKIISPSLTKELFDVKADISGGLSIEDIDVFLVTRKGNSGNDLDVPDGRRLNFGDEDAGPGSELRFNFNIENTFTDKEDIDINDATVKVIIEGIDDGTDIEEESQDFDLGSNENLDVDVIMEIPLSVEAGLYDVSIEAQGVDDNGNEHIVQMSLKLDVNKETRDVIISGIELFPQRVKCAGTLALAATIKNIGQREENEAKLEITNSDLGINFVQQNINLEADPFNGKDEFTKSIQINIGSGINAGAYPITVKSYLNNAILWETKTANLVVEACDGKVEEKKEEKKEEQKINETEPVQAGAGEETAAGETVPVLEPETTTEVSLTERPAFWIGIVLLNIIIIGAAAFWIANLLTKK